MLKNKLRFQLGLDIQMILKDMNQYSLNAIFILENIIASMVLFTDFTLIKCLEVSNNIHLNPYLFYLKYLLECKEYRNYLSIFAIGSKFHIVID